MNAEGRREAFLAETEWLANHLDDPSVRVVDIRGLIKPPDQPKPWYGAKREEYDQAHITGAIFIDWLTDIVEPDAPVRATVASPQRFAALMGRLGIGDGSTVIAYDDGCHTAARLWWALNYYGHPEVRLLNGGCTKWVAEGRPVTGAVPQHPPAIFTPKVQPRWRAGMEEVWDAIGNPDVCLVDCRTEAEYRGRLGRGERKGRIPGAVSIPIRDLVEGPYKTWKSEDELRRLHEAAGVTPDKRVITYCNAGVSASVGLFALTLLGYTNAANYAGSWYDWEREPSNPVEVG